MKRPITPEEQERREHWGLCLPYRAGDRCQRCGLSNWFIGRKMAECAGCAEAVPLEREAA